MIIVSNIKRKGFPTSSKKYKTAHAEATRAEKKKFPAKNYNKLKHLDYSVPKNELIGKNTKSGKIEISKKVPKKLRAEVAFHERVENKAIKRLIKKRK